MNNTVICPGSFDPVTLGHVDIIKRASKMFDKVIVAVLVNMSKTPSFTIDERIGFLKKAVGDIENVEIVGFSGLLADYAKERGAKAVVKGLRAMSDFEYEFQMALTNKKLNPELDTVFLTTDSQYMYLSSSMVKQIASLGGDISYFVPACIHEQVFERLKITETRKDLSK
ncbi:MAG: pantetheine-phosphate adenylyltransferase [Ruminococcaceae bacterium]|nr:pantetheine-phosphate adenylyltransferase [Oscillospiraceae bacterium]